MSLVSLGRENVIFSESVGNFCARRIDFSQSGEKDHAPMYSCIKLSLAINSDKFGALAVSAIVGNVSNHSITN